jgi:hypothetical protein
MDAAMQLCSYVAMQLKKLVGIDDLDHTLPWDQLGCGRDG